MFSAFTSNQMLGEIIGLQTALNELVKKHTMFHFTREVVAQLTTLKFSRGTWL
jgi:hypothetical protein